MSVEWGKLAEWLKPGPVLYVSLSAASLAALALPPETIAWLGLTEWLQTGRGWVGGTFLVSAVLSIVEALRWVFTSEMSPLHMAWKRYWLTKRLRDLSEPEMEALRGYLLEGTSTQYFPISDGVANGLAAKKIIYQASSVGTGFMSFAYNLQPWAWQALRKDPSLIGLAEERLRGNGRST